MAFFLIGRGPDDDLRLITPKPFATREAAMAELSLLSSDPAFPHWDAQVSVMDLDTGAPVLLVRSAASVTPAVEPAIAVGGGAGAWEADLPEALVPAPRIEPAEPPEPLAAMPIVAAEPIAPRTEPFSAVPPAEQPEPWVLPAQLEEPAALTPDLEALAAPVQEVPEASEAPSWEPPSIAVIEPVGDPAIADAIAEEAVAAAPSQGGALECEPVAWIRETIEIEEPVHPPGSPAPEAALSPDIEATVQEPSGGQLASESALTEPVADDNDELRAAILRTTEHMTAEGIVPPESAGHAPEEPARDEAPAPAVAEETLPEQVLADDDEPQSPASGAPDAAATAEASSAEPAETPAAAEEPAPSKPSFWPWARSAASTEAESGGVAPEVAGVYDALQEPTTELPEPDVEAALSRPILLTPSDAPYDETLPPRSPMSHVGPDIEEPGATGAELAGVDSSDFILDLDAVESAPIASGVAASLMVDATTGTDEVAVSSAAGSTASALMADASPSQQAAERPVVSPVQDYTCEDCVYVSTCPNRDQRLPKDCGSFQWR